MALPAGVTTCTVVAGVPVTHSGAPVKTFVSIEPSVFLVHAATGTPLVDFLDELTVAEGVTAQFTLPHTDQAGFQDENGNSYTHWYYTARVTYSTASKAKSKTPKIKIFQLTTGQTTVDLDLLPSGAPALPYIAPSATVSAFHGRTGPITLQESDLPARLAEAALSDTIGEQVLEVGGEAFSPTDVIAEASPLYQYGHSFGASPGLACTAGKESYNLLGARLKSPTITTYAKSGSGLFEVCYDLAAVHTTGNGPSSAGSQWPVGGRRGVVILDCETNNCTHPDVAGNVQALPAGYTGWYTLALRSVLALLESASRVEDNDAAVTVSGSWLTFTSDLYSGGSIRRSNTANAYMDIPVTVPAGVDHVWLMAYAQYEGSTFEVSVDGGTATPVVQPGAMPTTRSYRYANFTQIITGPSTVSPTYSFPQFVKVPITPGAHTVRMKRTDAGTGYVFCDGLLVPSTKPPLVITFLDPLPGTVGTRAEVVGRTQWIANKALLDPVWTAVSAEFPNVRLLDNSDLLAKGGVSQNTNDSLHPNDRGMAIIAARERAVIAASGDPDGLYVTL